MSTPMLYAIPRRQQWVSSYMGMDGHVHHEPDWNEFIDAVRRVPWTVEDFAAAVAEADMLYEEKEKARKNRKYHLLTISRMEVLRAAPVLSDYVPLAEYQSQTPASFSGGSPVLYFHAKGTISLDGAGSEDTALSAWKSEETIEIWVTSEKLLLWNVTAKNGLSISYLQISIHALGSIEQPGTTNKVQALYLEINTTNGFDPEEEDSTIALHYVPEKAETTTNDTQDSSICQQLYDAVTDCANLHPDPVSQESSQHGEEDDDPEDGPTFDYEVLDGDVDGMPAAFPGSGGWITSENMNQFFDEEGNWRGRGLGPGAGIVRTREDEDGEATNGTGDHVNGDDATKWQRTD